METMRITDAGGEEGDNSFSKKPTSSFMDQIKARSNVSASNSEEPAKFERATGTPVWEKAPQEQGKVVADVQSAKLKQLLGQIKST
jgi:hypothetical protein